MFEKQPAKAISRVQEQIAKSPQNSDMYDLLADLQTATGDPKSSARLGGKGDAAQSQPIAQPSSPTPEPKSAPAIQPKPWPSGSSGPKTIPPTCGLHSPGLPAGVAGRPQLEPWTATRKLSRSSRRQPVAANNLAFLMVETGQNLDVALSLAQIARRGMPNSPSSADTLAWVYYQKGNYASARDLLEEAIKTAPNDAAIHYHLGMTYAKLSNSTDAVTHLKKAAALAPNTQTAKDADKELALSGLMLRTSDRRSP